MSSFTTIIKISEMWGYLATLVTAAGTTGAIYRYRDAIMSSMKDTVIERKYLVLRDKIIGVVVESALSHLSKKENETAVTMTAKLLDVRFDYNGSSYRLMIPRDRALTRRQRPLTVAGKFPDSEEEKSLHPVPGIPWFTTASQIGAEYISVSNGGETFYYEDDVEVMFGNKEVIPNPPSLEEAIDVVLENNDGEVGFVLGNQRLCEKLSRRGISVFDYALKYAKAEEQ